MALRVANMKLTRRQKTFLAVLGLGLTALIVDRTLLTPLSAAGDEVVVAEANELQAVAEQEQTISEPNYSGSDKRLSDRLDAVWADRMFDPSSMRDAFGVPARWGEDRVPEAPGASAQPDVAVEFMRAHTLKGVMLNEKGGCIRVDDLYLAQGEMLDGYTLVDIGEVSATFESDGRTVVLRLRGADNGRSRD